MAGKLTESRGLGIGERLLPVAWHRALQFNRYSIVQFVTKNLPALTSSSRVLDVGSGSSEEQHFNQLFERDGARAHRCDIASRSGIDYRADLHHMPIRDNSYDLILCTQVLQYVQEPRLVCAELGRILKPGGHLFLTAPQSSHLDAPPHHYFHFTSYGLKLLLQNAGVEVLRLEPQGGHFRYLGTQLHYICVVIRRAMQTRLRRIVLFPVLVICTVLFGLFTKVLCLWLDRFDHDRLNTMGWNCHARRPANTLADISPAKYKHGEIVMRRSNRVLCATLVCLIYFGFLKGAYAYLDPGTGSYVIQVVIAVVAGALLTAKMFWTRIKLFFKNLFSKKP